ncbi:MAG TPA: DUF2911 domain-containing protein [Terriglobales bacterium]|nr:DUF2911 domain-containing protein [Terriglobales bacterium]
MKKNFAILVVFLLTFTLIAVAQQDKTKRPSPPASAQCKFPDGQTIKVDYSSPRAKSRKIFGGLVPYGEVWRTGANEATTFITDTDLTIGGKEVPAGSYTIFTIPNQDKWTLIINKKTGEWGIPYKYEADELARVDMQVSKTPAPVENFTIDFDQMGGACTMRLEWENTRATVQFAEKK